MQKLILLDHLATVEQVHFETKEVDMGYFKTLRHLDNHKQMYAVVYEESGHPHGFFHNKSDAETIRDNWNSIL